MDKLFGNTCCFIGHRKIEVNADVLQKLTEIIEYFIVNKSITIFLFGSRSEFDNLCWGVVTELKDKYPQIQRIYVRAEYPYVSDDYFKYLLKFYENSCFPLKLLNTGRAVYRKRNEILIDHSDVAIFFCDKNTSYKSGTKFAYDYASVKKVIVINLWS